MRATRNWGTIRTGETFEALATTVIFFEDSGARLFGRRGRDGGQDARSGDGKTVYQAKHHAVPTAAKAIADARNEVIKIAEYRKSDHARHAQWAGATNWVLVTNASFNPSDERTWETEVVPHFTALGLTAAYWEQATLDGYLDKHPEVDRAFFENENRVFLSPAEACLRVADDDLFTQRAHLAPYVGRESDLTALDTFLSSAKSYLQVHAAGGIGKTRFVLEGACRIAAGGDWQVLWANVHSLEASSTWFDAVVPERPTLLIVDEPADERLIRLLKEQLGRRVGRAQQWKIVIAVRSSNDPVLRALGHPQMKRWVDELLLLPLTSPECEEMCRKLLDTGKLADAPEGWRQETARTLARRFDGYPIWLTLAVHLLEEEGSLAKLPATAKELCGLYLNEALKVGQADEKLLQLARWVALLGPINREDETELEHLGARVGNAPARDVREALQRLTSARLLRKWGSRDRLVDVKPDVLRDFILRDWFCEARDYGEHRFVPSEAATTLSANLSTSLVDGTVGRREERVLAALARVDFLLRHGNEPADLGASLFAALNSALPNMTSSKRIALVEKIAAVGPYYPEEVLQLLRRLRLEDATEETVQGYTHARLVSQTDVVLQLAHAHHRLAYGVQTDKQSALMFDELYALVLEEKSIEPSLKYGLPNDGKRAEGIIRNLLESGPFYSREFGDVAADLVLAELKNTSDSAALVQRLDAIQSVVKPLCAVQRHQAWSDGPNFHMQTEMLFEEHPNRKAGAKVQSRIRAILQYEVAALNDQARVKLWDMVSEAHRETNFVKGGMTGEHSPAIVELDSRLLDDLQWVKKVLEARTLSPRELRAARTIWDWHAEFGNDGVLDTLARELEAAYLANPAVQLFESLTDWEQREDTQRLVESHALKLASEGAEAVEDFVAQAVQFLGQEDVRRVHSVASALGRLAIREESVRAFLTEGFRTYPLGAAAYEFAVVGISTWVFIQRRENQHAAGALVGDLLELGTTEKKLELLKVLYGTHYSPDEALITSTSEIEIIRRQRPLFAEANATRDYVACTLWSLRHDWPALRADLNEMLQRTSRETRLDAIRQLVEQLHRVLDGEYAADLPTDLLKWFWDQLAETEDLGFIEHASGWHIDEILKSLGKAPVHWLVAAVRSRAIQHEQRGGRDFDPPSRLIPLVRVVDAESVSEPEVQAAVGELVGLLGESALMAYWLPQLLARADPHGLEVPRRVGALIDTEVEPDKVQKLVRTACYYGVGTPAWRQIARPAFKAAQSMPPEERLHVYYYSSETGRRSWSAPVGTVAQLFVDAVEAAKRGLAGEQEQDFVPFWEWRVKSAEDELRRQEERLKEEVWG
jgi:hypothetical protein